MNRVLIVYLCAIALVMLPAATPLAAQGGLIDVSIQPDNTNWEWQPYADAITEAFENSIESRVTAGYKTREFAPDSAATVLTFAFRIGLDGKLVNFRQINLHNRYHAYLIRRTSRRVEPFRALPSKFPAFYLDGLMTFTCRFQPTRWYKKLYFEQPLDTLKLPNYEPIIRPVQPPNMLSSVYEPLVNDKNQLLADFKDRIGIAEEITDTSAYTALGVKGRVFHVRVPYDSLTSEPQNRMLLQARLSRALEKAGARITDEDYDPEAVQRKNEEEAARLAAEQAARDSAAAAAAVDSTLQDSTLAETVDSSGAVAPEKSSGPIVGGYDSTAAAGIVPPGRNLVEAFGSVFKVDFLVISAGLARDSLSDSAACRIKIYQSSNPSDLKRNLVYKFRNRGVLPDSIGERLVQRLENPPAKPEPPAPAKPAVDSTKAAADSTKPAVATDTTRTGTAPPVGGAPVDSSAMPADSSAATAAASAPADSSAPAVAPAATPAETPADSSATQPAAEPAPAPADSAAAPPAPEPAADSSAAPAPADSTATPAPADSTSTPAP